MSGPVRRGSRSAVRSAVTSPYSRPTSKKSSWSLSNLFSYINPLASRSAQREISPESNEFEEQHVRSAETLSTRGHQISNSLNARKELPPAPAIYAPPPPASASPFSSVSPTSASFDTDIRPDTPEAGLDSLNKFLHGRPNDKPLSSAEAETLISLIKKSTPADEHETFRFSSGPSTPQRGNSPLYPSTSSVPFQFSTPSSLINATQSPEPSPTKLLKSNPNGSYRWQGGGSAKPSRSRNRFHSPAFGPSRPSSERLVLRESPTKASEPIKTDTKRRRVGEEASTSSPAPSGTSTPNRLPERAAAPAPSPTRAAQAVVFPVSTPNPMSSSRSTPANLNDRAPQTNGLKSSVSASRLKASVPPKSTTPFNPSPLRQGYRPGSASPSAKSDSSDDSPRQTKTATASMFQGLIDKASPVKRLEVSNPYQAASPVRVVGNPKPRPKRVRVSGKPELPKPEISSKVNGKVEETKKKDAEKEYLAQDIIEATLPKGSKRSRAPASIGQGRPSSSPKSFIVPTPQIEEMDDAADEDESKRKHKKVKSVLNAPPPPINGSSSSPLKAVPVIEEVDADDSMSGQTTAPSEVIEPDKTFALPSSVSNTSSRTALSSSTFGAKPSAIPKEPSKLRFSYKPEPTTPSPTAVPEANPVPGSAFANKVNTPPMPPPAALSTGIFTPAPALAPKVDAALKADSKETVRAMPVTSLPTFTFAAQPVASGSGLSSKKKAMDCARAIPKSELPQFEFSSNSASSSFWSSPNPIGFGGVASAFAKPNAMDPVPVPSPAPKVFNWTAAGLEPPSDSGEWTCSLCMLKNTEGVEKCTTCDMPRPGKSQSTSAAPVQESKPAATATPTPIQAFNWAAAGMKPPEAKAGVWICGTCACSNPDNKSKCEVCDSVR